MKFNQFEDIIAWQKAKELALALYRLLKNCNDFDFRRQILRAAISIMNNIAEGFERQTNKEFKQFLFMAKGSSAEVRSMLYLGLDLHYLDQANFKKCLELTFEISKILSGLIKTL